MFTWLFKNAGYPVYAFGQSAYTASLIVPIELFRPYSEVDAKLVPPNGVPSTKYIPSSCGGNTPKSGNFRQYF